MRWNPDFRVNFVGLSKAVIFSANKYLILLDSKLIMNLLRLRYRLRFGVDEGCLSIMTGFHSRKLLSLLIRNSVVLSDQLNKTIPKSESFVSFDIPAERLNHKQKHLIQAIITGRKRVIYQLYKEPQEVCGRRIFRYASSGIVMTESGCVPIFASGSGLSEKEAAWRFLGEALERSDCASAGGHGLRFAEVSAPNLRILSPTSLICFDNADYSRDDFPFESYDHRKPYLWVKVCSVQRRVKRWVPAQFVHVPFTSEKPEGRLWQTCTSGVAAGRTTSHALTRAVLELVERDGAMRSWFGKRGLCRISDWHTLMGWKKEQSNGITTHVFAMENLINYPCVFSIITDESGRGPAVACGTAADLSWPAAIQRAIFGALSVRSWLLRTGFGAICEPTDVQDIPDHGRLYWHRDQLKEFEFVWNSPSCKLNSLSFGSKGKGKAADLFRRVTESGHEAWFRDLSSVRTRRAAFRVVRAIIPELVPLQFGYRVVPLGMRRLREVVNPSLCPGEGALAPHPFV